MRRPPAQLAFLVFALLLAPERSFGAEATTGSIAGTVRTQSGAPLGGVAVSAAGPSARGSALTDARGAFTILGLAPDTYTVSAQAPGYDAIALHVGVAPGQAQRIEIVLEKTLRTLATVRATAESFALGGTSDAFAITGAAARALAPPAASAGLGTYGAGTVQGAVANVPGVDLDSFANAILRGGKIADAVFEYDSVSIPQGLVAEPGGNIVGAQLPTTGIASTTTTLAGYTNQADNSLAGVIDEVPATGTYPSRSDAQIADGLGPRLQSAALQFLAATPDLRWRYAVAATSASEDFSYGDGRTFYPAEAATYGLALQNRSQFSLESNVHYRPAPKDDLSALLLAGQARYDQYGSPFAGETIGAFDGTTANGTRVPFPGETNPNAPVRIASSIDGSYDIFKLAWTHTGERLLSRAQLYRSQFGSSAGGPFWDENGFPDGAISLTQTQSQRETGFNYDTDGAYGRNRVRAGAEYRINASALHQLVPTADEVVASQPTLQSYLVYASDTVDVGDRLALSGTLRLTHTRVKPSAGFAYGVGALDPHAAASYRIGRDIALRATFDATTVAPAPLEADRTDSANVRPGVPAAPFVALAPERGRELTFSIEGSGRTQFRATYYRESDRDLIDVLPFNFRSAAAGGVEPNGIGIPTNAGDLRANGFELWLRNGGFAFSANVVRARSSSASQFAYNDLNAPAVAAGHLFGVGYEPDCAAEVSYEFAPARRVRITPSLAFETGYPYGNGTKVYVFDRATGKPLLVPNDNHVNPGFNYYFLRDPALPYDPVSNPYIGNLGTPEGSDPNTLRAPPHAFVNLHVEGDLSPRATLIFDVANLLGDFTPTERQGNPWLIGPPGYAGGNPLYAAAYEAAGGFTQTYVLGNGVPTNDGVHPSVPWTYGRGGYVPQSFPMGRALQLRLRYRI